MYHPCSLKLIENSSKNELWFPTKLHLTEKYEEKKIEKIVYENLFFRTFLCILNFNLIFPMLNYAKWKKRKKEFKRTIFHFLNCWKFEFFTWVFFYHFSGGVKEKRISEYKEKTFENSISFFYVLIAQTNCNRLWKCCFREIEKFFF